jgi:hypothetical protein
MYQASNICTECGIRPIVIKKCKLCKQCYNRLYYRNRGISKPEKTSIEIAKEKINRAATKYGPDLLKDLELLKTKPFWTIKTVGVKYGISKERVSQLFETLFGESVANYQQNKKAKVKEDIALLDSVCDMRHLVSKSSAGKVRVFEKCIELGFETYWAAGKADLVVNGYRVGVNSNLSDRFNSNRLNRVKYFDFKVSTSKVEDVNFFIFYAASKGERWFIVPTEILKDRLGQKNWWRIYIPVSVIDERTTKNIYWKYEDAWSQLTGKTLLPL